MAEFFKICRRKYKFLKHHHKQNFLVLVSIKVGEFVPVLPGLLIFYPWTKMIFVKSLDFEKISEILVENRNFLQNSHEKSQHDVVWDKNIY